MICRFEPLIFQGVSVPVSLHKKSTAPLPYASLPHPRRGFGGSGREQLTGVETCGLGGGMGKTGRWGENGW